MIQPKAPQILYTFCKTPNTQSTVRRERPRSSPKCGAGVPTFSVPLLSGASSSEQRSGLLPLLVGGGGHKALLPIPGLTLGPPGRAPPPVLCWNTEEGWQGSSCTSQPGQNAKGLDQGWAWGQLGRLASWGNPEAAGVGAGERTGVPWVACPPKHGT